MRTHILKIKAPYFTDILLGLKTFEIRRNNRDYKVEDILKLQLYPYRDNERKEKEILARVTYVLKNIPEYGLNQDYCILGIKKFGCNYRYTYI